MTICIPPQDSAAHKRIYSLLLASPVQAGPFDGGCLIFAQALCLAFPNATLVHLRCAADRVQHYGVYQGKLAYDMDGPVEPSHWAQRFISNEKLEGPFTFHHGVHPSASPQSFETSALIAEVISSFASKNQ